MRRIDCTRSGTHCFSKQSPRPRHDHPPPPPTRLDVGVILFHGLCPRLPAAAAFAARMKTPRADTSRGLVPGDYYRKSLSAQTKRKPTITRTSHLVSCRPFTSASILDRRLLKSAISSAASRAISSVAPASPQSCKGFGQHDAHDVLFPSVFTKTILLSVGRYFPMAPRQTPTAKCWRSRVDAPMRAHVLRAIP